MSVYLTQIEERNIMQREYLWNPNYLFVLSHVNEELKINECTGFSSVSRLSYED